MRSINSDVVAGLDPHMDVSVEEGRNLMHMDDRLDAPSSDCLQIAFCLPEPWPLHQVMSGELAQATYIQQGHIAAGLKARGHSLTFLAPRNLREIVCTTDLQSPTLAPLTWSGTPWFNLASRVAWRVQRWLGVPYLNVFSNYRLFDACLQCLPGHDVVYELSSLYRVGVSMACKRLKLPYVLFFDGDHVLQYDFMDEPVTGILRWRAQQMTRCTLAAADCVICVSKPAKVHLATAWRVPAEKIVVLPNGVDVQRFRPYPEARSEVRASLGLDTNPLVVFVGSFYPWHDVATLLDAFGQVLAEYPRARLMLVGDGRQLRAMEQRAADLGLRHAAQFIGSVPHAEIPRLVSAADVAVAPFVPRKHDLCGSPMKLFEYMASGTAVIASAVGQVAAVLQHGTNGLLVPPEDAAALAWALKGLIGDPSLRLQLGMQAREDVVRRHSWNHYVSRLERIYATVISRRPVDLI